MEYNKEYKELCKELDQNIPAESVVTREAWRGGPKLSYLSGAYVIDRMNQVIGQGKWGYTIKSLQPVYEGTIAQTGGEAFTVSYIATIQLSAFLDGNSTYFDEVGYGDGTDKKSKGKAHELATKEAITDALKRAVKNLGRSMGLGLYFKSGEYIEEAKSEGAKNESGAVNKPAEHSEIPKYTEAGTNGVPTESMADTTKTEILRKTIQQAFKVLQAQKRIDKDTFVKTYLQGGSTKNLSDSQVNTVIGKLKENFPDVVL